MLSPKSENTDPLTDRYCIKKLGLYKILTEWLLRFLTVQERTALLPTRADTLWDEEEVSILSWPGRELEMDKVKKVHNVCRRCTRCTR